MLRTKTSSLVIGLLALGTLFTVAAGAQVGGPTCEELIAVQQPAQILAYAEVDCTYQGPSDPDPIVETCPTRILYVPSFGELTDAPGSGQSPSSYQMVPVNEEIYACDDVDGCVLQSSSTIEYIQSWTTAPCI